MEESPGPGSRVWSEELRPGALIVGGRVWHARGDLEPARPATEAANLGKPFAPRAGSISAFPPLGRSCSPRGGVAPGVGVTLSSLLLLSVGGVSPGNASCPEHSQGLG